MNARGRTRRDFLKAAGLGAAALGPLLSRTEARAVGTKPNIIWIMLDELGYFELSCMGNEHLLTPNVDRMASEGMRFTQALAGGCVCAPTRSVFLTGRHTGHTTVRSNGGRDPLREDDVTVAEVLKEAGYATGGFGKWGVGDRGTTGVPERHGFDTFFGYYHQVHAHSYYPRYLLRNSEKVYLEGNTGDVHVGKTFSHYLIYEEAVKFIRQSVDRRSVDEHARGSDERPFFCYCPWTPPHGLWGFPEDDPSWALYKDKRFGAGQQRRPQDPNVYAAMVNMIDRQVGEIMALLKELGVDRDTMVVFSGDNGGQPYFKNAAHPHGAFKPNGGIFRGGKGNLYEGGLRVPCVVRWPGMIEAGAVCDHLWYFADVMPTLAELAGVDAPESTDGISIVPALLGEEKAGRAQAEHEYFYWEHGGSVAVRMGNWKAIRPRKKKSFELYDLAKDVGETNDVAAGHADILAKMLAFAERAHTPCRPGRVLDRDAGFKGHRAD